MSGFLRSNHFIVLMVILVAIFSFYVFKWWGIIFVLVFLFFISLLFMTKEELEAMSKAIGESRF